MGKIYKIKIDSETYFVEIEEVVDKKSTSSVPLEKPEVEAKESKPVIEEKKAYENRVEYGEQKEEVDSNAEFLLAPLPGKILKVFVKPGDRVKKGDVLLTIEAMKMENEMFASFDATVAEVYVKPGDKVETNKKLLKLVR